MERHGHDTVCGVESLLYSITVVDVNVNIQNSLMVPVLKKQNKQKKNYIYIQSNSGQKGFGICQGVKTNSI